MHRFITSVSMLLLSGAVMAGGADADAFTSADHRIPISVTATERNQILYEMREFLHGMHNIHHALARNDMKAVAIEARPLGQMINRIPTGLRERLPEAFMQMGIAMHEAFDHMAKVAENDGAATQVQEQMAEVVTYCSGCHDTYRFELKRSTRRR